MWKTVFTSALLSLLPLKTFASNPVELTIRGIEEKQGNLMIAIFDSEEVWLDIPQAILLISRPAAEAENGTFVYKTEIDLPSQVSISVYQDLNEDNKLNENFLGKPTEPYGFTNNIRHSTRPATFEEARITIPENSQIEIELKK